MGGRTIWVTYGCLGQNLKSYYLRVEGLTKPPASALVQNLSPSTYGWKDKPSHSWVSWWKVLGPTYRWMDEPCHSRVPWLKFRSFYLRVEGRTKPPASSLVQNLCSSIYGWKDEPSHSRMSWSKFKSFYQRVKGRTESLIGALVEV